MRGDQMVKFKVLSEYPEVEGHKILEAIEDKWKIESKIAELLNGLNKIDDQIYVYQDERGRGDYIVFDVEQMNFQDPFYEVRIIAMSVLIDTWEKDGSKGCICAEVNHLIYNPIRYAAW